MESRRWQAAALLKRAVDATPPGRDRATQQQNLGIALYQQRTGNRKENIEQAIQLFEEAMKVFTREADPRGWALAQSNLGNAYTDRLAG
jgi:tetratricopeptide (TPR) repeat protein